MLLSFSKSSFEATETILAEIPMRTCVSRAMLGRPLKFKSLDEIFAGYAAVAPLALALYRTAEAKHLSEVLLLRPVLDLGCGSGEFGRLSLRGAVDVGMDVSWRRLVRCRKNLAYRQVCLADACRMPFADERFQTVLAVSVLEHLHQPHKALDEVCRILRPGGCLIGTVTLIDMYDYLFYPWLLGCIGLSPLARLYVRLHKRLFAHRCLLSQEQWNKMLAARGLELLFSRKSVSPRLTRYWDLLLALAWPWRLFQT